MRKLRWLTVAAAVISMLAVTSFGAEAKLSPIGKAQSYSIEEAQKLAIDNSKQAIVDDLDIKAAQSALDEAKYDGEYKFGVDSTRLETNLEVATRNKARNIEALKINVYKSAVEITISEKELQKEKDKLTIQEEKHSMLKAKYDAGMVTESDINSSEYSLDSQKNNISRIENKLEMARLQFKRLLNLPLDDKVIKITDELTYSGWKDLDLDGFIADAVKNSISVYQNAQNIKMKEEALEKMSKGWASYYDAEKNLEFARADYNNSVQKLELDIRNRYNDLLNRKDSVELAGRYLELVDKSLKNTEKKFDMGMVSKEQLLDAKSRYLDAVYQKYAATRDYNTARLDFENMAKG